MIKLKLPLKTKRLLIREFTKNDKESYYELMKDKAINYYIGSSITRVNLQIRFQDNIDRYQKCRLGSLAIYEAEMREVIGFCGFDKDQTGEGICILVAFLKNFCKKGYGYEAMNKVLISAFKSGKIEKILCRVDPENFDSINLLKKFSPTFWKCVPNWNDEKQELLYCIYRRSFVI